MTNDRVQIREGYNPQQSEKKGYQPTVPNSGNSAPGKIQGGYQPSTSQGTNPINPPTKK